MVDVLGLGVLGVGLRAWHSRAAVLGLEPVGLILAGLCRIFRSRV